MTDDKQPEEQATTEETGAEETTVATTRAPRGNRSDDSEQNANDIHDRLREQFSSKRAIGVVTVIIVIVAVIAGIMNMPATPTETKADWIDINRTINTIREEVNQNAFDPSPYQASLTEIADPLAKAWIQLELGSALIASALTPDTPNSLPGQRAPQQPVILYGNETTIDNRVSNLSAAYTQLSEAIGNFEAASAVDGNPLVPLGLYRSNYAAAYVKELLLVLDDASNFSSHRGSVIEHLEAAKGALPAVSGDQSTNTDKTLKDLTTQIDERLAFFEEMSATELAQLVPDAASVPQAELYSWLNLYIKDKHARAAAAQDAALELQNSGIPTGESGAGTTGDNSTSVSDDGDFPIENDSDSDNENSTDDAPAEDPDAESTPDASDGSN